MLKVFTLFSLICCTYGLNYQLNTDDYFRMPNLYEFDDYEKCLRGENSAKDLYCVVNSYIKPDNGSDLYNLIANFSSNRKQHLRHDKLQRGLCLSTCKKLVESLGNKSQSYFVEKFPMDSKLIYDFIKYENADKHRALYDDLFNKCVNEKLLNSYSLRAFTEIEYCVKGGDDQRRIDTFEKLTGIIFIVLFALVILSTFYDRHLRNQSLSSVEHYKANLKLKSQRVLTIFSIKRNWKILSAPAKKDVRDLRFIEALRSLIMFGVIHNHCSMFCMTLPSSNPIFIDNAFSSTKSISYLSGNPAAVQTFMVIGGFLTAFLFLMRMEKEKSSSFTLFLRGVVGRYARLAPLLALTILVHATWLYRLGDGPFWDKVNFSERQFCRENWWTNLIFLDNYINVEEKCLIHSWYVAADFWLRIMGTVFLIQYYRKPTSKFWILSAIFGFSAISIGYTVYVNRLSLISIFPPENIRNLLFQASQDEINYFKILYSPTHLNIGNYFIGIVTGCKYYDLKASKSHKKTLWLHVLFYLCVAIALLNVYSTYLFYAYDFEEPSVFHAIAAAAIKHIWGLAAGGIILGLVFNYGWFTNDILNYSGFRVMGRICYATFMCHLFVVKLLMSSVHQPLYLSDLNIMSFAIASYVLSNAIGFMLTLTVEVPVTTICNMLNLKRGL